MCIRDREKAPEAVLSSFVSRESGKVKAEKMLLRAMMESQFWRETVVKELEVQNFSRPEHRRIFRVFADSEEEGNLCLLYTSVLL